MTVEGLFSCTIVLVDHRRRQCARHRRRSRDVRTVRQREASAYRGGPRIQHRCPSDGEYTPHTCTDVRQQLVTRNEN